MTEKKIALVKNESIGKMAYDMGLNNYYIIKVLLQFLTFPFFFCLKCNKIYYKKDMI